MNNKIILQNGKELIGISNIVVSEIDDKIYINTSSQIEDSVIGSFAVYRRDSDPSLMGTGNSCTWDYTTSTLKVENIDSSVVISKAINAADITSDNIVSEFLKANNLVSTNINSVCITTELLDTPSIIAKNINSTYITSIGVEAETIKSTEYANFKKLGIDYWFGFRSKDRLDTHPFKIDVAKNPNNNKEMLLFCTNDYDKDSKPSLLFGLEDSRAYINGTLNITFRTIESSIGAIEDIKNDIAIDDNFIYICVKDFDGVSNIWKRCPIEGW